MKPTMMESVKELVSNNPSKEDIDAFISGLKPEEKDHLLEYFLTKVANKGSKTVCFTGHRPDKLIGGYDMSLPKAKMLAQKLTLLLEELVEKRGVTTFISGGALGFDQIAFMCVHNLKKKHPAIRNILAVPFKDQAKAWRNELDIARYEKIKENADTIVYVDELPTYTPKGNQVKMGAYSAAKMQLRNQYMVDKSDLVIAAWDGTKGGTKNCVDYAKKKKKEIIRLDPSHNFNIKND